MGKGNSNSGPARVAGIGDDAVRAATGKTWAQWCKVLDKEGGKSLPHKEIAKIVSNRFGVRPWWSQMVTVGYEQARGLRKPHETAGGYRASVSKTIGVPLPRLFAAWKDARSRSRWLGREALTVRKATANKSMRITWPDETDVEVNFYAKAAGKSLVALQHGKLSNESDVQARKAMWTEALAKLKEQLENGSPVGKPVARKADARTGKAGAGKRRSSSPSKVRRRVRAAVAP